MYLRKESNFLFQEERIMTMINTYLPAMLDYTEAEREQLSEHFTLTEMVRSATAIRLGLKNVPDDLAVYHLRLLCRHVLEPLRRRFGVIRITSGYRSKKLNDAVGGAEFSQHRYGMAADIYVPNAEVGKKMYEFIRTQTDFDQLIYEYRKPTRTHWIHVSYNPERNRKQAFMNYIMK